jgi:hypothetical protein
VITQVGGATRTINIVPLQAGAFSMDVADFPTDYDYAYMWHATAKDKGAQGGNTGTSSPTSFTTGSGTPPPPTDPTVTDGAWEVEGGVKAASGRILFTMPDGKNYVCSGTVVVDETLGRSIIITAAHCVFDDVNKAFSSNALFIPNQDGSSSGTDFDCSNDPIGCWSTGFGVVDKEWTLRTFPNNKKWDYAYYVVDDTDPEAHRGSSLTSDVLDKAVGTPILIDFSWAGSSDLYTHAIGYSYDKDPDLRYCAENVNQNEGPANWWLGSCAMSGGSSGGPWMEPIDTDGMGSIVSVNSWGYTNRDGMAGPLLQGNSAACVLSKAKVAEVADVVARGVIVNYDPCEIYTPPPPPPPIPLEDGVPVSDLSGSTGAVQQYYLSDLSGGLEGESVTCSLTGNNGDADLYLRFRDEAEVDINSNVNECGSYTSSSIESCTTGAAPAGTTHLYAAVHAFAPYSGLTILCDIGTPPCDPAGTSCTASGQCCSNNCNGKPGSKSCK